MRLPDAYWIPIREAILVFPLIAAVITVPYGVIQYRKYERIPIQKILIFYSFVFYLLCAFALVVLPLPSGSPKTDSSSKILLHPLESLRKNYTLQSLTLTNKDDLMTLLQSREVFQLLCNILLTLPFGVYLRYYTSCRWYTAVLSSFLLSLFFEITQLTGLFFLYPEPYRYFELDDLICNTLGGLIGFWLEPLLERILPTAKEMNRKALIQSCRVSVLRQLFATVLDWLIVAAVLYPLSRLVPHPAMHWYETFAFFFTAAWIFVTLCLCLSRGYTPGKRICRLKIVRKDHGRCAAWRLVLRSMILYLMLYSAPFWIALLLFQSAEAPLLVQVVAALFSFLSMIILGMFAVEVIGRLFGRTEPFLYETLTRTYCASVKRKKSSSQPEKTVFLS